MLKDSLKMENNCCNTYLQMLITKEPYKETLGKSLTRQDHEIHSRSKIQLLVIKPKVNLYFLILQTKINRILKSRDKLGNITIKNIRTINKVMNLQIQQLQVSHKEKEIKTLNNKLLQIINLKMTNQKVYQVKWFSKIKS